MKMRKIRRFVINEDKQGDWTLTILFNKGRQKKVFRSEEYERCLDAAKALKIEQPVSGELVVWK